MRALVTGATGYVGSRLVARLLAAGAEVVAGARTPAKLVEFDWFPRVETVALDVLDPGSVRAALAAAGPLDAAYYLVHGIGEGDYESSDRQAAETFVAAAGEARVRRIVYLGGFVPADEEMSPHLRSRAAVGRILAGGDVDAVLLQAAVILGAGSTSFEIVRHLVDRLPVVPLPPFMRHRVQPIAADDVLHYLLAAADPAVLPAGTYDVAGDEVTTYAGLARLYARAAGLRRVFLPVPVVPARLAAAVIGPLTPVPDALVADLVRSVDVPMVGDARRIRQFVPDPLGGLTGLRDGIARAVAPPPEGAVGVARMHDELGLAETDADWAGPRDQG